MYKVESCYIEMIQEDISEQTMIGCTWIKNGVDKDNEM
jgi:Lon protease-like protein